VHGVCIPAIGSCSRRTQVYPVSYRDVASADISFIYHYIRGQATIKLYVVFNVLEVCIRPVLFILDIGCQRSLIDVIFSIICMHYS